MKLKNVLLLLVSLILATSSAVQAQTSGKAYQQMSQRERSEFVALQARRIAAEMSGRDYEFTPAFIEDVEQAVTHYTKRMGMTTVGPREPDFAFGLGRGRTDGPA